MPFRFSYVCDLLQRLEDNQGARSGVRTPAHIVQEWFRRHQGLLGRDDHDATALLSTLLPEKRSDRVYFIREKKLQTVIGRSLGLGRSRIQQLGRWDRPGSGIDLADCVESILKETVCSSLSRWVRTLHGLTCASQTPAVLLTKTSQSKRLMGCFTTSPLHVVSARLPSAGWAPKHA